MLIYEGRKKRTQRIGLSFDFVIYFEVYWLKIPGKTMSNDFLKTTS